MIELYKYFYCGFDWCQAAVITINNSSHFVLITNEISKKTPTKQLKV